MASERVTPGLLDRASASSELGAEWRRLTRFATAIAILTSPAPFAWFHFGQGFEQTANGQTVLLLGTGTR